MASKSGSLAVRRATLEAELKLLKEDCHRVMLELQQRRLRVDRLQSKFDVMSKKHKSVYDEDEPRSQAYYVIKNAQEREELQKSGDVLDGENQRLEREARPARPLVCLLMRQCWSLCADAKSLWGS
jgi:coiled-coil domain-containing protein 39